MERLTPARGRMQVVELPNGARIIQDDYKSSLGNDRNGVGFSALRPSCSTPRRPGQRRRAPEPTTTSLSSDRTSVRPVRRHRLTVGIQHGSSPMPAAPRQPVCLRNESMKFHNDLRQADRTLQNTLQPGDVLVVKGRLDDHLERLRWPSPDTIGCWRTRCRSRAYRCITAPCWRKVGIEAREWLKWHGVFRDERTIHLERHPVFFADTGGAETPKDSSSASLLASPSANWP